MNFCLNHSDWTSDCMVCRHTHKFSNMLTDEPICKWCYFGDKCKEDKK